jgi:hypothetical protein
MKKNTSYNLNNDEFNAMAQNVMWKPGSWTVSSLGISKDSKT